MAPPALSPLLALALIASASAQYLTPSDLPTDPAPNPIVLGHWFVIPAADFEGLRTLNPFLTDEQLANVKSGAECDTRADEDYCSELPAFFSGLGLSALADDGIRLMGVTDNGPFGTCPAPAEDEPPLPAGVRQSAYFVPAFAPTISEFRIDQEAGGMALEKTCFFKGPDGEPLNGLPNTDRDDVPMEAGCETEIDRSPNGIDPEDIHRIPGTDLCLGGDEYSPSAIVFNCNFESEDCGTVMIRYVPEGLELPGASYEVRSNLPSAILNRRKGRGIESAAVSPDGKSAYLLLQSAMGPNKNATSELSHTIHVVKLDITNPMDAKVAGLFLYIAEDIDLWVGTEKPADTKISAAFWASEFVDSDNDVLVVLERSVKQVKLFLADFTNATDVVDSPMNTNLTFDNLGLFDETLSKLEGFGISPAKKAIFLDTGNVTEPLIEGWDSTDKQEGVVLLNKCVVAMANDNDFGEGLSEASSVTVVHLDTCVDEVYDALKASGSSRKLLL